MRNKVLLLFFFMLPLLTVTSCKDDDDEKEEASELTKKVNKFINQSMSDVYLWYNKMPNIDYNYEIDSKKYFKKLLYEDDKWSYITDDIDTWENSLQGVETTYGWALAFGLFSKSENVFAIVEYVYPNSPASKAGIKRGDIIVKMNSAAITKSNYTDLLYSSSMSITLGVYDSGSKSISVGDSYNLTALKMNLDPVVKTSVVEQNGEKIGYIFYAQYIANYNSSLDAAFEYLKAQGVSKNVVLDLRYNPGGGINAARYLCSSLAPLNVVNNKKILVTFQWNDKYQKYWEQENRTNQLKVNFIDTATVKMGLTNIYILTGHGTASASELTITGLDPYMTVTTVGDTTSGKYAASITLKPEDLYKTNPGEAYYSDFNNWGLQPIVLRYANSEGVTDFKNGFVPDVYVHDNLFNTYPLGDVQDPLFAAAIKEITGAPVTAVAKRAKVIPPAYRIFDRGFSKFDKNKSELPIGSFESLSDYSEN